MSAREIVVRLRAEIGNFVRDMRQAGESTTAAAAATRASGRQMQTAMTQTQAEAAELRKALHDAGKAAQDSAKGYGLSYNAAGQLTDEFGNLVTEAHAAELGLETASDATREYAAQAQHAAAETAAATEASRSGIDGLLATASANEDAWNRVGKGLLTFGLAVGAAVGLSMVKFSEFDAAMSSVDAATHETTDNMELLRAKAIQVGADTAFSAVEAAQGIEELAKAGVSTKDILGGGLAGSMDLAAAGALAVADAAEISATAMVQFGLAGSDIPHIADLLAAGAGKAQGSVQDIGMALGQSGLVAAQFGLSVDDTVGSLAAFASAGLTGSDAGTSFKSMLLKLAAPAKATKTLMDDLGISAYDAEGSFVGITGLADQLKNNLGDLTQAQRDSALATIFGTDAIRGANVLYEQGAEGIQGWIDNVNDAGYAAETAARMQDNLRGDIEKLGGAFDTLMIKSGTGPSEMLRGIVQAAEAAVDAVGQVPTPVLTAVTVAASLVGGLALLGGAFITIVPKIAATRAAMAGFNASSAGVVAGMKKIGIAGGIAALAIVGLGIASAAASKKSTYDMESIEGKLIQLAKSGGTTKDVFNEDFFKAASESSDPFSEKITSVGQALRDLNDVTLFEGFNQGSADFLNGIFGGEMTTQVKETQKAIQGMSDGLATMVQNGDGAEAALAFSKIAEDGQRAGVSLETTAGHFDTYEAALRKQANTLKVSLTDAEYQQWMLGNVPPLIDAAAASAEGQTAAAEAQAAANEEVAQALAEVGLKADGTVQSLSKLLDAMFATGLAQLSANEASIRWQESLEGLDASIAKYGNSLDITTEAGKANQRALDGMGQAGIANMQAMASNGATQEELQGKLRGTYDSLVQAAGKFGITGGEADAMARKVLGIPDDANVDTAIQNYADSMAKLHGVGQAADALNGKTANVWITTHQNSIYSEEHVSTGQGGGGGQTRATGGLIQALAGGGRVKPFPMGGFITGPGSGTSDEVPVWASNGEFMQRTAAVKKYGLPFMESVNNLTYEPPSMSVAAGYAPSLSRSAYTGGSSSSAPVFTATVVVENPWTGQQVQAVVKSIAVTEANNAVSAANTTAGRRPAR